MREMLGVFEQYCRAAIQVAPVSYQRAFSQLRQIVNPSTLPILEEIFAKVSQTHVIPNADS